MGMMSDDCAPARDTAVVEPPVPLPANVTLAPFGSVWVDGGSIEQLVADRLPASGSVIGLSRSTLKLNENTGIARDKQSTITNRSTSEQRDKNTKTMLRGVGTVAEAEREPNRAATHRQANVRDEQLRVVGVAQLRAELGLVVDHHHRASQLSSIVIRSFRTTGRKTKTAKGNSKRRAHTDNGADWPLTLSTESSVNSTP